MERLHTQAPTSPCTTTTRITSTAHSTSTTITTSWFEFESPNHPNPDEDKTELRIAEPCVERVRGQPADTTTTTTTSTTITQETPSQTPPPVAPTAGDATNFEVEICVICQETMVAQEATELACKHVLHRSCATQWFAVLQAKIPPREPNCPYCRGSVNYLDLTQENMPGHARQHRLTCQYCFEPLPEHLFGPNGLGRMALLCGHWFHHECYCDVRMSVLRGISSPDALFGCPHCQEYFAC